MQSALLLTRQNARTQNNAVVRVVRRRFATVKESEAVVVPKGETVAAPIPAPHVIPKKKRFTFRRIFWTTAFATGTFYVGSLFLSFNNNTYYDFFSDNVPLGQALLEYGESHKWDRTTLSDVTSSVKSLGSPDTRSSVEKKLEQSKVSAEKKFEQSKATAKAAAARASDEAHKLEDRAKHLAEDTRHKLSAQVQDVRKSVTAGVDKARDTVDKAADKAGWVARHQAAQIADDLTDLRAKAESALRGEYPDNVNIKGTVSEAKDQGIARAKELKSAVTSSSNLPAYPELPIGFEPPPGYTSPKPTSASRPAADPTPSASLKEEPRPLPGSVPYSIPSTTPASRKAAVELTVPELESRLKEAERRLDEQLHEHKLKMLEFELTAQDALDKQEHDFRHALMSERERIAEEYRKKMDGELGVQRELIEERLKESLSAQSVELQRRWIREIKVLVEQERGGRLSKINDIQLKLKALQGVALDNAEVLDESARAKSLTTAVNVLKRASLHSPAKRSFREEVRTLRSLATASRDDLLASALLTLDNSTSPDIGVEPLPDLAAWFATSVSPKAAKMALVPSQDAGLLTHLASSALSMLTFRRLDEGQLKNRVDGGGDDVLSTLARAEWHLKTEAGNGLEGLEKATRELNQLPAGTSREICEDWLTEARRRLEVGMLIEVIETQATLSSLLYSV